MCEVCRSIQKRVSSASHGPAKSDFRLQLILPKVKYCNFQKEVTWMRTSVICCFHIFTSLRRKTKPQTGVRDSKEGC